MKWGNWSAARRGLVLVVAVLFVTTGVCVSSSLGAVTAKRGRLVVSWPATGFPGYKLVVSGRAPGWGAGALVLVNRRERGGWRRVSQARADRAGRFAISWRAPKAVGSIMLRLTVDRRSRMLARSTARVHIRPLPIVIPARDVMSVPAPGQAGWISFKAGGGRSAHAASGLPGCVPIPAGPQLYGPGGVGGKFVSVGYNKDTARHGFLGRINFAKCGTNDGRLYATPVSLNEADPGAPLDLGVGFSEVEGAHTGASATAQKTFDTNVGPFACSAGAAATLSGNVSFQFSPTFQASFQGLSLSSAKFELKGTASASVGVDANANASCPLKDVQLVPDKLIGTFQGFVGPFYAVVELRGELDLSGSLDASVSASDRITATAKAHGGVEYSHGTFTPIKGSSFTVANTEPDVNGTASASVTLTPKVRAFLYGLLGPELDLRAGLQLNADSTAAHCWTLYAPVSAQAAFDGFGKTWASHEFDIADKQLGQAPGPCTGGPTPTVSITNPGDQTGTTGGTASLQIDAVPSDKGVLRYSAIHLPPGLQIDQITGLISGPLNAVGTYHVTVTATDASGPSNSTTFTWTVGPAGAGTWQIQPIPDPTPGFSSDLWGVSCTLGTACTVVGDSGTGATLAERWNGLSWQIQPTPTPAPGTSSVLKGVSCTSATACIAVGYNRDNSSGSEVAQVESWNGSSWQIQPIPTPTGPTSSVLQGVSCTSASACVAVGYEFPNSGGSPPSLAFAEVWDGSSWQIQSTPSPTGTTTSHLNGVSCTSATACTAVGDYTTNTEMKAWVERWDGSSWQLQTAPGEPTTLNSVWCASATACIAVGDEWNSGWYGFAEVWDGSSWQLQTTPNPTGTTTSDLKGVSCTSATACIAVGSFLNAQGEFIVVEVWDGSSWQLQTTPNPTPSGSESLTGVSCTSATTCTAAGDGASGLFALADG